jgi:hypothetical protein
MDGAAAPDALRELVREVLRDILPAAAPAAPAAVPAVPPTSVPPTSDPAPSRLDRPSPRPAAGARPDVRLQPVRVATDEELHQFVLQVLRLADNPKQRRDLLAGRLRFTLAAADRLMAGGAGGPPPGTRPAAMGDHGEAGAGPADHRVEKGAVTERVVVAAASAGARLVLGPRAVLTPLARDRARALGVPIEKER